MYTIKGHCTALPSIRPLRLWTTGQTTTSIWNQKSYSVCKAGVWKSCRWKMVCYKAVCVTSCVCVCKSCVWKIIWQSADQSDGIRNQNKNPTHKDAGKNDACSLVIPLEVEKRAAGCGSSPFHKFCPLQAYWKMIEFIDCIDLAETCVAYQCLLPVKSSFLAMVEIEGGSLARQVGVRRATLFKKMCFSLDLES